jgi:hypothetical protein
MLTVRGMLFSTLVVKETAGREKWLGVGVHRKVAADFFSECDVY